MASARLVCSVASRQTGEVNVVLRPATTDDLEPLSELAMRSKGHWGYDDEFLAACKSELTLTHDRLASDQIVVADVDGDRMGYFALVVRPPGSELVDLFVEPAAIGTGIGRVLWDEMLERATTGGAAWVEIEADPNAVDWYLRRGAQRIGRTTSGSIPGRELPILRVELSQ
jgi:GNAT superfamily N-acetyltransferase